MLLAFIPSPSTGVLHLGPLPLRAYAGFILLGVVAAVWLGERRWVARGGVAGTVTDIASIAVPVGLVGARLYHVITSPAQYLDHPIEALYVWRGGLGIWGGIAGGTLGAYLVLRKRGLPFLPFADALAPGVVLAQAIGRIGNYFNQELFGKPTTLPWALKIDPDNRPSGFEQFATFHPTFLYELLWNLGVCGLVLWADRRFQLGKGRAFALYVAAYCVGRFWIEALRIDDAQHFFGLRLNDYVAGTVFLLAAGYYVARRGSVRETLVQDDPEPVADVPSKA